MKIYVASSWRNPYQPAIRKPYLMLKMAGHITSSWESIELWLRAPLNLQEG